MRINPGTTEGRFHLNRLETWLRANRWTVALVVPLVGVFGFALHAWFGEGPWSAFLNWPPLLVAANLVMVLPLAIGLQGHVGGRGLIALALLAVFSWIVEGVGVATGWPYGRFSYALGLEPLLFDLVPLALPLFWVPMVINAWLLAIRAEMLTGVLSATTLQKRARGLLRISLAVSLLVFLDVIMDPGAVALGFWAWDSPGPWYGVPWINFGGWALSGSVGMSIVAWGLPTERLRVTLAEDDLVWGTLFAFLTFWALINAIHGQWIPALLAFGPLLLVVGPAVLASLRSGG